MPDDTETTQVTEQHQEPADNAGIMQDEVLAFNDDSMDDNRSLDMRPGESPPENEVKKPEGEDPKDADNGFEDQKQGDDQDLKKDEPEKTEPKVEPEVKPDVEIEDDEDVKRGKEIIEAQEKTEAEAKQKEDEARAEAERQRSQQSHVSAREESYRKEDVEFIREVIPKDFFPKGTIELSDGELLDFETAIEATPELPVMIASIAHNIVTQMVENGYLLTTESGAKMMEQVDNKLFTEAVRSKVPNAEKIDNKDLVNWLKNEPKEIQVLNFSKDPQDKVRLLTRFINKMGKGEADEQLKAHDDKRRKSKDAFDKVHSTTVRSKGKSFNSALSPEDEEMAAFNEEDTSPIY